MDPKQKQTALGFVILVIATLGLIALFLFNNKQTLFPNSPETSSISEARSLGHPMRCTYQITGDDGMRRQATVLVEGSRYRAELESNEGVTHVVFNGQTQYFWNDENQSGYRIEKACFEELRNRIAVPIEGTPALIDLERDFKKAEKTDCVAADSAEFVAPQTVTFTDQCALLRHTLDTLQP